MMKEIQRKKKVLIDLTNYGSLTAGFGQIAANYATAFSSMPVDDLHFVYLLRQKYMQEFGPNVTLFCIRRRYIFAFQGFFSVKKLKSCIVKYHRQYATACAVDSPHAIHLPWEG